MTQTAKEMSWMEREWVCPHCDSREISDHNRVKRLHGCLYKTEDVICGSCYNHYRVYSDMDPMEDGSLLGDFIIEPQENINKAKQFVYLITSDSGGIRFINGIFSSKDKADKRVMELEEEFPYMRNCYYVNKWEVDK